MITGEFLYVMLVLPALFGLTLVGEGVYKMSHYQQGWINMALGVMFLAGVAFRYFYLVGYVR